MHQPGIEPGSHRWQRCILPLDHWCSECVSSRWPSALLCLKKADFGRFWCLKKVMFWAANSIFSRVWRHMPCFGDKFEISMIFGQNPGWLSAVIVRDDHSRNIERFFQRRWKPEVWIQRVRIWASCRSRLRYLVQEVCTLRNNFRVPIEPNTPKFAIRRSGRPAAPLADDETPKIWRTNRRRRRKRAQNQNTTTEE